MESRVLGWGLVAGFCGHCNELFIFKEDREIVIKEEIVLLFGCTARGRRREGEL